MADRYSLGSRGLRRSSPLRRWSRLVLGATGGCGTTGIGNRGFGQRRAFHFIPIAWLRIKSTFRNYATAGRLRTISFRSEGLHLESEDLSADYKWSLFHRIVETHRAFHFIVGPRSATVLPKRSLSNSGEMQMLRQLIRENFKGKKRLRPD